MVDSNGWLNVLENLVKFSSTLSCNTHKFFLPEYKIENDSTTINCLFISQCDVWVLNNNLSCFQDLKTKKTKTTKYLTDYMLRRIWENRVFCWPYFPLKGQNRRPSLFMGKYRSVKSYILVYFMQWFFSCYWAN